MDGTVSKKTTIFVLPEDLEEIESDLELVKSELKKVGVPAKLLQNIRTKALKSGRRQTGEFQSNRDYRWRLSPNDPQYGTEVDCKLIEIRLLGMILEFENAPTVSTKVKNLLETKYLGEPIMPGTYRDSLLLEKMDFSVFLDEITNPKHGSSNFHLGHENPLISPRHSPDNIAWRSHRSNLIQGNMTLRDSRIYFVKLIARYFELGEIELS